MKYIFSLILCLLLAGCSTTIQVVVKDGECNPIQDATIYHLEAGVLLFKPWGPFYTDNKGVVVLPANAIVISISKEQYKPFIIEKPDSHFIEVFLYSESELYLSGLFNYEECKGNK